jgi:hypothetical protein
MKRKRGEGTYREMERKRGEGTYREMERKRGEGTYRELERKRGEGTYREMERCKDGQMKLWRTEWQRDKETHLWIDNEKERKRVEQTKRCK